MDLSIIIPIYNTDNTALERCFASICAINGIRYECLLVDDGSRDDTADFCKMYASQHADFRYIRKNNGGVSAARNFGISLAFGKFICFVDSDDEIVPGAYSVPGLLDEQYDLIFTDLMEINGDRQDEWRAFDAQGEISVELATKRVIKDGKLNGPYCKMIKRSFLDKADVRFREDMIQGEDAVFIRELLCYKPRIYYWREISYLYHHSYAHSNQRFIRYPNECIHNVVIHNDASIRCIQLGDFTLQEKNELSIVQNKNYIHELFDRAMDSVEYGVCSNEFQLLIKEIVAKMQHEQSISLDALTNMKVILLNAKGWTVLKCVERMRYWYYKIRGFR